MLIEIALKLISNYDIICRYEALKASPSEIRAFEEEVAKSTTVPQQFGDIKTEDLPGKEILNERGKREGQTILVKDGGQVSAYMWSEEQQTWNKIGERKFTSHFTPNIFSVTILNEYLHVNIFSCFHLLLGDVMGSAEGAGSPGGKIMFEGKEYDYVFNVDIDDNAKPLKLPYNINQDPWQVAQAFIHKHQLPQDYLSNVANFIITNTKGGDSVNE